MWLEMLASVVDAHYMHARVLANSSTVIIVASCLFSLYTEDTVVEHKVNADGMVANTQSLIWREKALDTDTSLYQPTTCKIFIELANGTVYFLKVLIQYAACIQLPTGKTV